MELTIEQALQQGVAAHNAGNLQEAERAYQAILRSQPKHPEANHNLGLIAISVNQIEAALPLFKIALNVNPNIEQFWVSYIDALVKAKHLKDAKQAIKKAKKKGFDATKLQALFSQSNVNADTKVPSSQQLRSLLEYYQTGQYGDAEKLAKSITQQFPRHQFAWKVLGAIFGQSGRTVEAENANQASVALSPQDTEAHNNLGGTLQKLGRLDEAEASLRQAIVLKPDFAEAHYNLGNTLKELGRLEAAEVSYKRAIALKPDYAVAHNNLGNTLKELDRLEEAEASLRQSLALKPDYAVAHNNLGHTLKDLGRLDEAEASLRQSLALKPDYAEAHNNLGGMLNELGKLDEAEASLRQSLALKPDYAEAHYNLGFTLQELGRLDEAEAIYTQAIALKPEDFKIHKQLLMCLFKQDKKSVFFDELDYLINQDKASAIIGSLTCRSALKYGLEKPNLFCKKPLNYVLHNDLNTRYDFEKTFVKKAKSILNDNRILNRRQSLLVNGNQTLGNIFDIKNDDTNEIQNIIRAEVEKYRAKFKKSEEGLIKKMPTEYSLRGWLISMKSGGNLKPHIHGEGWLSGSIYINVPQKLKVDSGNLVLSLGEENDAIDTRINEKKIINVVTGSMVLFPSSLTHYTIPFESEEERIVLAFDVKEN
jgi:tetratricopeptide (TPR) repeat protein